MRPCFAARSAHSDDSQRLANVKPDNFVALKSRGVLTLYIWKYDKSAYGHIAGGTFSICDEKSWRVLRAGKLRVRLDANKRQQIQSLDCPSIYPLPPLEFTGRSYSLSRHIYRHGGQAQLSLSPDDALNGGCASPRPSI